MDKYSFVLAFFFIIVGLPVIVGVGPVITEVFVTTAVVALVFVAGE